jgi:hypothetical protein
MEDPMNVAADMIADALDELVLEQGWKAPIHFALLSANCCVFAGTYEAFEDGSLGLRFVVEQATEELQMPINMTFIDPATGRGENVRIEPDPA